MQRLGDTIKRHPWRTAILVLVIILSLVLKLSELKTGVQHEFQGSDPYASNQNAIDVLNGNAKINTYLNPFVTLYLMLIYSIFGLGNVWIAKFIQVLASFAIPFFLYYFTRKYFGDMAGYIAALLSLLHPSIIFYSAHLWSEFWIIFFFCAMLYLFTRALENKEHAYQYAFAIGIFAGIASLGKIWMALVGATLILSIIFLEFDRKKLKAFFINMLMVGGLALLGIVIILVPWIIYASHINGFFVMVNINSQTNLYIGNNPEGEIAYTSRPYNYDYIYPLNIKYGNCGDIMKNTSGTVTTPVFEHSVRLCAGKYATAYILGHPGKFISKMTTFTFKYWLFPNLEFYQRYIKTPKLLKVTLWAFWILGLVGLLVSLSKFRTFIPLYVILLVIWFFSGMAFYLARYKAGMSPIAVFFAAGGLYTIGYFLFDGKGKK
jgi:4-amino-4-deoxy-L-arabinose transferase-like glycosyltransferase